mmetsp:Transcript_24012/g.47916  ORF Transcript_24012/g.47916 Transcript_24012/m.47916 type:complete len:200 (-) Transcript_24012:25-624(-)
MVRATKLKMKKKGTKKRKAKKIAKTKTNKIQMETKIHYPNLQIPKQNLNPQRHRKNSAKNSVNLPSKKIGKCTICEITFARRTKNSITCYGSKNHGKGTFGSWRGKSTRGIGRRGRERSGLEDGMSFTGWESGILELEWMIIIIGSMMSVAREGTLLHLREVRKMENRMLNCRVLTATTTRSCEIKGADISLVLKNNLN